MNRADGGGEFVFRRVFQQEGFRTRLHGAIDVFVRVERGQHDDAGFGKIFADRHRRLDATHAGQAQIHQHHVRFFLAIQIQRFTAIAGLRDDFQAGLTLDERGHAFAERRMIVHEHDPDGCDFFQSFHGYNIFLRRGRHPPNRVIRARAR